MARYVFKLPDVGEGTAEAELVAWHVAVGDRVAEDQPLADVMTDKATVELTSPVAGVVRELHGAPGDMRAVKSELVILEVDGQGAAESDPDASDQRVVPAPSGERNVDARDTPPTTPAPLRPSAPDSPASPASPVEARAPAGQSGESGESGRSVAAGQSGESGQSGPPRAAGQSGESGGSGLAEARSRAPGGGGFAPSQPAFATRAPGAKPLASPAVRRRAHELGVQLQYVPGTGPAGRISHADLDGWLAGGHRSSAPAAGGDARYAKRESVDELKVIGLRRRIAQQMQESKRRIPHFMYAEECDVTELEDLRAHLNATKRADQPKLTLLPFMIRAMVKAVPGYPNINARFDDEAGVLHRYAAVHVGMATQTANGLIVPVIRHAETMDVWGLAAEIARLAKATRDGSAGKDELSGSTITLTSLGPLGGLVHTPVVNHPETAIVGPNRIIERPVVRHGQIVARKMMNVSSSFDHRVVDGHDAAEFIQTLKGLLEHPATLFM